MASAQGRCLTAAGWGLSGCTRQWHQGVQVEQGEVAAFVGIPAAGVYVVDIAKAGRAAYRGVAHHQGDETLDAALVQPLDAAP